MNPIASKLGGLPRETLEEILLKVVDLCYLVEGGRCDLVYDLEGDVDGGHLVDALTQLLDRHGLTSPEGPAE